MRKINVYIDTTWAGIGEVETVEVPDNATNEEIDEVAREVFYSYCSFGWGDVEDEEEQ